MTAATATTTPTLDPTTAPEAPVHRLPTTTTTATIAASSTSSAGATPAVALALEDVTVRRGEVDVLRGVDLSLPAGRLVALLGPSGSGKTTMLAVAGGLLAPTAGTVRLLGDPLHRSSGDVDVDVARRAAFVLQAASTVPFLTAEEHLVLHRIVAGDRAGADDRARAAELLAAVDLADRGDRYPDQLSGGERQRLCVAQALATGAPVVLADEPTASLDRARGRAVVELLADHAHGNGATVLVATHDERALDLVDAVVRIEDGTLIA
ncbi:MAG: ABC transporter ATP-binding protein [Acidimicrobiales bacterium]